MSKRSTHNRAAKPKASLYEEITTQIIADLEAGIFPWARPWGSGGGNQAFALPKNAATGKTYSGIDVLILRGRLFEGDFTSQRWLTFRQASHLGGTVRKGEHGITICYADRFVPKRGRDEATVTDQGQPETRGGRSFSAPLHRLQCRSMRQPAGSLPRSAARLAGARDRAAGGSSRRSNVG